MSASLKLDIACGANCRPGFEGVDIAPVNEKVKHVLNLMDFPWVFADASVDEIFCSHYVEHISPFFFTTNPRFPIAKNMTAVQEGPHSVSLFLKFFDEIWRILKPGGKVTIACPQAKNDRAWQDPTHTQFIVPSRFLYLDAGWRKLNGLEHAAYAISCDFKMSETQITPTFSEEDRQRYRLGLVDDKGQPVPPAIFAEALQAMMRHGWNRSEDLIVTLSKGVPQKPQNEAAENRGAGTPEPAEGNVPAVQPRAEVPSAV